jgi:thiol:disulfide interchange protein
MKKLLLIAVIASAANLAAFGQDTVPKGPAAKMGGEKPAPTAFVREKFDPLRDPKADLVAALALASKTGRRIILDVGGEWCGWCVHMDKFIANHAELARLRDDNFVWIKVNFSPENENPVFLAPFPAASGYPHLYVLSVDGKLLHSEDTSLLEAGKTYNLAKFTQFLSKWSPKQRLAK